MSRILKKSEIPAVMDALEEMHPDASCALHFGNRFQLVVAVSLSAQTTDVNVNRVTPLLFEKYPNAADMAEADVADVEEIIHSLGFFRNKAKNVVAMAKMLVDDYGGEVPCTMEELVKLPGVGRKTANVVLAEGFGMPAIAVDTHVFRVSNRIGLADGKTPDEVEKQLRKILPKEQWSRAHHLLIFHGRYICHARKPDCANCRLLGICRSGVPVE